MNRVGRCCGGVWSAFSRTKTLDVSRLQETEFHRCLSVIDLIALGVGSTLGAGIYILTGQVAKTLTGPGVVISFLIAAFASFLAGICYAEFAGRVPKAGSAYVYSYVSVGELWAFIIGWNMILENVIGAATSGKAWSQFMDSMFNDTIRRTLEEKIGSIDNSGWFDSYPDFLALAFLILATLLVCVGVKISSSINLVFTIINLIVIACIIGIGLFYSKLTNWTESKGGFFPFGFRGVLAGAATCFYSFVGFDTIATSGEESMNPTRHVPIAIVSTLIICLFAYVGVSSVLTLMVPWNELAATAALPKAFAQRGIVGAEYIVAIGGICGLTAATLGSIFPLPRSIYAMAQDGLLFRWLGHVWKLTDTPVISACISGALVAVSALLLDIDSLVEMMSIGTLMAYTLVAVSVLVLHYQREMVGLTAADMQYNHTNIGGNGVPIGAGLAAHPSSDVISGDRVSLSEDTGLLRVGEGNNRVRYVPTKTTTVVKRVKPPTDSDEELPPSTPTTATKPLPVEPEPEPTSVVEEYRAKVQQQQLQQKQQLQQQSSANNSSTVHQQQLGSSYQRIDSSYSFNSLSQLFNAGEDCVNEPTARTRRIVILAVTFLIVVWVMFCALTIYGEAHLSSWWAITLLCVMASTVAGLTLIIGKQPRNTTKLNFSTPLVPFLPLASVMINIYLMITLSPNTWIRFAVWMSAGFIIYFGYGVWHSTERRADDQEVILYDVSEQDGIIVDGVYR